VILDVEPPRMPPFDGFRGGDDHVLMGSRSVKVDSGAAYQSRQTVLLLHQGDDKEIPPEL
jgi:hypothetical protein